MSSKYCYKIRIVTTYKDDMDKEDYVSGIYVNFDKAVSRVDRIMRDMLEEIGLEYKLTESRWNGTDHYWTNASLRNHPEIEDIYIETEHGERILG